MNIVIYRNRKDNDIKKVTRFIDGLEGKFPNDINVKIVQYLSKDTTIETFKDADIIIIFSHGDKDKIYYCLSPQMDIGDDEGVVLIDRDNAEIFKNKKVIVFACETAQELGPYTVDESGSIMCRTYIGFKDTIDYSLVDENRNRELVVTYFYRIYCAVFEDVIISSINNNFTPAKVTRYFRERFNRIIRDCRCEGVEIPTFPRDFLPKINDVFEKTLHAMVALGNTTDKLIS